MPVEDVLMCSRLRQNGPLTTPNLLAALASCLSIGILLANHWFVSATLATLPIGPGDFGVDLPPRLLWAIKVDHLFTASWFILGPLIFGAALLVAFAFYRLTARESAHRNAAE